MLNLSKPSNAFIACDGDLQKAQTILFGAPFDGTTSYRPGTRFGPNAIRNESDGLETYSPYQDKDLVDYTFFDAGDLTLPFGNTQKALDVIEHFVKEILEADKRPAMLGGEHLVSLPAIRAVWQKYPNLHVLHFDAHTDLRADYLGEPLSHATVIRRVWDFLGDGKIFQFGIRSGEREEFLFAKTHGSITPFTLEGVADALEQIGDVPLYVTIDLDVLDPSIFPGTGTPEAGGVTAKELFAAIVRLKDANVVAFDINELSPHYDPSGVSTAVAGKVLREMLLATATKE